jgi:hypothetical protein
MKKSLNKMQSLYALLFLLVSVSSKMLNDRNIENALSISNHYCSSEMDKNILMAGPKIRVILVAARSIRTKLLAQCFCTAISVGKIHSLTLMTKISYSV